MISLGVGVLAAACSKTGAESPDAGADAQACLQTVAEYCAAHTCERTWADVLSQCPRGDLYACGSVEHATYGSQNEYYNVGSGALIAITRSGSGECIAGPPNYQPPPCTVALERPLSCAPQRPLPCDCCPGDLSSFMPTWKPPTSFHQGKCTDVQVATFVDCLNGKPDAATCKTFVNDAANKACLQCADTPSTATKYGPLVSGPVTIQVNVSGCIALSTGDLSATGCGAKVLALSQCEQVACEANCPVSGTLTVVEFDALLACQNAADTTSCKMYADDAKCADALTDGGVAAACVLSGATFADNAKPMVKLFCGSITDAGAADAGDGG